MFVACYVAIAVASLTDLLCYSPHKTNTHNFKLRKSKRKQKKIFVFYLTEKPKNADNLYPSSNHENEEENLIS